jgi:hypothetical protein
LHDRVKTPASPPQLSTIGWQPAPNSQRYSSGEPPERVWAK